MVQFLSIFFFSWISSIFVGFFKSSRFFVSPYTSPLTIQKFHSIFTSLGQNWSAETEFLLTFIFRHQTDEVNAVVDSTYATLSVGDSTCDTLSVGDSTCDTLSVCDSIRDTLSVGDSICDNALSVGDCTYVTTWSVSMPYVTRYSVGYPTCDNIVNR